QALRDTLLAYWSPETLHMRNGLAQELLDSAKASRDPAREFWAYHLSRVMNVESGEFDLAQVAIERLEQIAGELGQPSLSWFARWSAAGLAIARGELARGEELAGQAFQIGSDAGEPDAAMGYGAQLFSCRIY